MKSTKSKVIIIMCVALLIMATGYAYFATNLDITATGNITSNWNVSFISITEGNNGGTGGSNAITPTYTATTATMSANLQVPGDYMEYEIVLKNAGNIDAIIESIDASATGSPAIIFSISGLNSGEKLAGGASKTIKVKIEYDINTSSQPTNTTKTLTVSIKAVQDINQEITPNTPSINQPMYLSSAILRNNVAQSDANIDFSQTSEATGTNGLYYTSTNTEDSGTTYYFRGSVDNNYVQFGKRSGCGYNGEPIMHVTDLANMQGTQFPTEEQCLSTTVCDTGTLLKEATGMDYRYVTGVDDTTCSYMGGTPTGQKATYGEDALDVIWRIVRINEDGSIRIVTQNLMGISKFNENHDDNAYVGYMYGTPGSATYLATHENTNDSTIKDYLDDWYNSNLSSYSSYLADAGFCNDRSVAPSAGLWYSSDTALGYAKNHTVYGAVGRLANIGDDEAKENAQPQFACPNEERNLFTTSSSSKGNKALTYPIGLLTMDEVAYAGAAYAVENESMYLTNGMNYLTMSPSYFNGGEARVWYLRDDGYMYSYVVHNEYGVRPAVNLQSEVKIIGGDGTFENPYVIKAN